MASNIRRVIVFSNADQNRDGRLMALPATYAELVEKIQKKLDLKVEKLFVDGGAVIDELTALRDGDMLYVSSGEDFRPRTKPPSPQRRFGELEVTKEDLRNVTLGPAVNSAALDKDIPADDQQPEAPEGKQAPHHDWIILNIGGRYFTTTRQTLGREPASMLARMVASDADWRTAIDPQGAVLIDRSPRYFAPILDWLRHGQLVLDPGVSARGVLEEARFYQVSGLLPELEARVAAEQPPSDTTPLTRRELSMILLSTPANCELRAQGLNFSGANLSRLDLRYVNMKYALLRNADLSGANLSYCSLERADLTGARMDGAQLLGVKMVCANLENASLRGCNFEDPGGARANLEGANLKHTVLDGSGLAGVNLRVATLKNASLQNCDLRAAVLAGADLENCNLSGCDLHEANLRGANLKDADLNMMAVYFVVMTDGSRFRLALVQMAVGSVRLDNARRAASKVAEAARQGAQLVALPECCNSPYGNSYFPEYAEEIPGPSTDIFAQVAKEENVWVVAGSIPERDGDKLYNTSTVFSPAGEMVAKFRKIHLFDIDIPGKITFQESKTLSPGNSLASFTTRCQLLLYPGCFNMTTGPAHWELLSRARALDNQLYVGVISQARDPTADYVAWGHSTVVNPWGEVIVSADADEQLLYADIDLDYEDEVRQNIPISKQGREGIY